MLPDGTLPFLFFPAFYYFPLNTQPMRSFRLFFLFLFCLPALPLHAQDCEDCEYISMRFDSVEVQTVKFGEGENADGNMQELFMDIYTPYGDTSSLRPVLIFAFGGGFIQGSRNESYVKLVCERYAKAGYVTAGIDYRIGFDPLGVLLGPNRELMRTFFRAMQDMRGSIQWFRAHADIMGNTLRIDTNNIISGGASAGGIAACMVAYCDKSTEFGEIGDTSAIAGLGGFYASSGLYPSYSWESAGIVNIAGAIVNTDWIEAGDPPIFNAHGDQDITVPYEGGNFGIGPISIGLEGSFSIDKAANAAGVCSYLYTIVGDDHPSGNESDEYYENIFVRSLPRAQALVRGQEFCCNHSVEIEEDLGILTPPETPIALEAQLTGTSNPQIQWCEVTCDQNQTNGTQFLTSAYTDIPRYFMVTVTEGNCVATDFYAVAAEPVGRLEPTAESRIQMYPVPASNVLNIDFQDAQLGDVEVRIVNVAGKIVWENTIKGNGIQQLELGVWPRGMYLLEVEGLGQRRFLKE